MGVHTMEIQTFSWSVSTYISTRLPVVDMFHVQFSWIWSQVPWTVFAPDHSDSSSVLTTLCLARQVQGITGLRAITQKALSSSTRSWTWCAKKQKAAIVCRDFKWFIRWVVALAPVWVHF